MPHTAVNHRIIALRRFRPLAILPLLSLLALGSMGVSQAWAASSTDAPPSASPGQVEKRLPTPAPSNRLQLNIPAPVESQQLPEALRAKLESQKFALKNIVIEGATVYQKADLAFAYQEYVGKTISLLDARAIANKITTFYRNNGYILSQAVVPAQDVTNGTLKIRVVEGFIGTVSYTGDPSDPAEQKLLDSYAENIKNLHPVNISDMERYMLLMNDLPGSTITGLIRPSNSEFGAADLVLTVFRKTFEGSYTLDNRGSRVLGPWQHTFMLGANSMIDAYDHTQVRVMTTDPLRELFLAEFQHDEILDDEGTKFTFLASHTRTEPGDYLTPEHFVGDSDLFEAKISHPFMRMRQESLVGRFVVDVHNTDVDALGTDPLTRDRLRIARVGGTYNFLDLLRGSDSFDAQLSQGMNVFEATSSGSERSNPNGDSAFTKGNADVSRLQPLPENFSLLTAATGQYSFEPLLTDEQFSLGGADYGRAFDPAEALGDSGVGGKAELRYDDLVQEPYFDSYQLFTFFDIEEAWMRKVSPDSISMSSVGVGTRFKFTDNFSSAVEADFPVIKPVDDQTDYRHDPRIFFTMTARF
jgi:hemolysin activation/secretion protein